MSNFGILSAWSKWLPVATGDHGRNLVISLRPGHKATLEWRHSDSPHPKKFRVQKSTGEVLTSIFWDQDRSLPNDYLLKGRTINAEYYSFLLVQLKGILKEKHCGKVTKEGSCSCKMMHRLTRYLQPRRNWPTWASVLITHPILRIWPCQTTTCSMDWKNNWKVTIFRPMQRSMPPKRPGWMETFLNFFEWLAKVRAMD